MRRTAILVCIIAILLTASAVWWWPDTWKLKRHVIIVGAGLTGLTAASELREQIVSPLIEFEVLIVEAQPTVGGRLVATSKLNKNEMTMKSSAGSPHPVKEERERKERVPTQSPISPLTSLHCLREEDSETATGANQNIPKATTTTTKEEEGCVELGATFIHGVEGNPIASLAQRFGLKIVPVDYDDVSVFSLNADIQAERDRTVPFSDSDFEDIKNEFYDAARRKVFAERDRISSQGGNDVDLAFLFRKSLAAVILEKTKKRRANAEAKPPSAAQIEPNEKAKKIETTEVLKNLTRSQRDLLSWHFYWEIVQEQIAMLRDLSALEYDASVAFRGDDYIFAEGIAGLVDGLVDTFLCSEPEKNAHQLLLKQVDDEADEVVVAEEERDDNREPEDCKKKKKCMLRRHPEDASWTPAVTSTAPELPIFSSQRNPGFYGASGIQTETVVKRIALGGSVAPGKDRKSWWAWAQQSLQKMLHLLTLGSGWLGQPSRRDRRRMKEAASRVDSVPTTYGSTLFPSFAPRLAKSEMEQEEEYTDNFVEVTVSRPHHLQTRSASFSSSSTVSTQREGEEENTFLIQEQKLSADVVVVTVPLGVLRKNSGIGSSASSGFATKGHNHQPQQGKKAPHAAKSSTRQNSAMADHLSTHSEGEKETEVTSAIKGDNTGIEFDPPLPKSARRSARGLGCSPTLKIALYFNKEHQFWPKKQFIGLAQKSQPRRKFTQSEEGSLKEGWIEESLNAAAGKNEENWGYIFGEGDHIEIFNMDFHRNNGVLVLEVEHRFAEYLSLSPSFLSNTSFMIETEIMPRLRVAFPTAPSFPDAFAVNNYVASPFVTCGFSFWPPGKSGDDNLALRGPFFNDRLYFAGEHTTPEYYGNMHGAVSEGQRVAIEIANREEQRLLSLEDSFLADFPAICGWWETLRRGLWPPDTDSLLVPAYVAAEHIGLGDLTKYALFKTAITLRVIGIKCQEWIVKGIETVYRAIVLGPFSLERTVPSHKKPHKFQDKRKHFKPSWCPAPCQ